jgi:hypothetical protein
MKTATPARAAPPSAPASAGRGRGRRRRRRPDRAVLASPGCSTCAGRGRDPFAPAAGTGHRRRPTARLSCSSTRRKVTNELPGWLGDDVALKPPGHARRGAGRSVGQKVLIDPAQSSAWYFDRLEGAGATIVRAMDPCALPRADQEPGRDRGHASGPHPRRRRPDPLPALGRHHGRVRTPCRTSARSPRRAGRLPRGYRRAQGPVVRHHRRRRPERRPAALQARRPDKIRRIEKGSPAAGRRRRPVSGRHHRRDPDHGRRRARRRPAPHVHPGAQGPYRHGRGALPGRHDGPSARRRGPPADVDGRASTTTTAPATASAAIWASTRGRSGSPRRSTPSRC